MYTLTTGHYRNRATSRTVEAIYYAKDGNNAEEVRSFLDARAESVWPGPHTHMGGAAYKTICFRYAPGSTLYVNPGYVAYVYAGTAQPYMQTHEQFTAHFTKETMTRTAVSSEYETNRQIVLDSLALLRTNPNDSDFQLVSRDIMDLLATAFNEGWDEGMEAGQRNPYENRRK